MTLLETPPAGTSDSSGKLVDRTSYNDVQPSDVKPGMKSDVKNLYQSKPDNRGKTSWVDKFPDDLEEAGENAESARYALLIRYKKCYDGRRQLQIDSIIIQSPLLREALGSVLKDYPGVTTSLERLTFNAPFQPFIHRWMKLVEALNNEGDQQTKTHLGLLYRTLEAELRDDLKARDDFILNGVITFDTCWMIFEPGTVIFSVKDGQKCAARLKTGTYQETRCGKVFSLGCEVVDWDGENFGLGNNNLSIWDFEGTTIITKLSAYPLDYHPNLAQVKEELIQRGKVFQELSGYQYKSYQGVAIGQGPWGPIKYNVSASMIMVHISLTNGMFTGRQPHCH